MAETRRHFKAKLKWCLNRQDQLRMDFHASNQATNYLKHCWKNTNRMNLKTSLPVSVVLLTTSIFPMLLGTSFMGNANDAETIMTEQNVKFLTKNVATIIS